ncbi:hypothetical protein N657DRAFT_643173 [Parathielavia appendiculata]|uniref:Uncharacterized protein n=1 Tax=Parathielavia appendiculata TaxID=2587402 RepID=A0AAN6U4Q1_9PEZI|nr:hypothetical protein N657DRAFT_643173 [Parathielavia appendiculata]
MQLVLINLLHIAWYQGWVSLLDEIDDSIKVQVGRMRSSLPQSTFSQSFLPILIVPTDYSEGC